MSCRGGSGWFAAVVFDSMASFCSLPTVTESCNVNGCACHQASRSVAFVIGAHYSCHCVCVPTVHCSQSRSPTATRVPLCPFTPFPCDLSNVPVLGSGRLLYRYTTWSSFREVVDGANNLLPHHSFVPITFSRGRGWG